MSYRIDEDGNIDLTNDGDNDAHGQDDCGDIPPWARCTFTVEDLGKAEAAIRASARRYNDLISCEVVWEDDTFKRIEVKYVTHDVIYDLHKANPLEGE